MLKEKTVSKATVIGLAAAMAGSMSLAPTPAQEATPVSTPVAEEKQVLQISKTADGQTAAIFAVAIVAGIGIVGARRMSRR